MPASFSSKEIVRLATIPRGSRGEEFRVSVDELTPTDGKPLKYVNARLWYLDKAGEMRPGRSGTTIRAVELRGVIEALLRAEQILTDSTKET